MVTAPAFQIYVPNSPITIFAGQTATFNGTMYALNGYNSNVNLSCMNGDTIAPQSCAAVPTPLLPVPAGTLFAVNACGNAGDYVFDLHALGSDPSALTLDFSLTLHILDFSLSPPSPGSVNVSPGNTSAPISFLVSAAGSFAGAVTLSCSGLPAGARCQFQSSNTVNPVTGSPASVMLTVDTSSSTPFGTSQVTITASTPGSPDKTQPLTLTVGVAPAYSLTIANPSLTGHVNVPAVFNGTLTSINTYSSPVNLSCGAAPPAPPTCAANPANVIPSSSGTPFTVTVSSDISQAYTFNITGVGTDPATITHSAAVNYTALPVQGFDFTLSATPSSVSVAAGNPALYSLDVSPTAGTFPSDVTFSCSKLPALTTCAFNPAQVSSGSGDSVVTLKIATTAPISSSVRATASTLAMSLIAGMLWLRGRSEAKSSRNKRRSSTRIVIFLFLTLASISCGGGLQGNGSGGNGSPGTPLGTYTITVTAASGTVTHSAPLSLTVTQ